LTWENYDIACEHQVGSHWNHFIRGKTGVGSIYDCNMGGDLVDKYDAFASERWDRFHAGDVFCYVRWGISRADALSWYGSTPSC